MEDLELSQEALFLGENEACNPKFLKTFQESQPIHTVVFDLGGVFFTNGTKLAVPKFIERYGIDDHEALHRFFGNETGTEGNLVRLGLMSMDEYERRFISEFNLSSDEMGNIRELWFESYVPNPSMMDLVKNLSCNYELIIFSGNILERIQYLDSKYDLLSNFDKAIFSYDYRLNKGDIEFYDVLLNNLSCSPECSILIDDGEDHLRHANSMGIHGIHYTSTEDLLGHLEAFGIEPDL